MSIDRLRELLHYNPETGVITRLVAPRRSTIKVGDVAGSPDSDGYLQIAVEGMRFKAHRIAWALMTGAWPTALIDHRDTNTSNNRWNNLRDATHAINAQNQRRAHVDSGHGYMGVSPSNGSWAAYLVVDGKQKCLGTRKTPEEAAQVYLASKRALHAGCTI